MHNFRELQIWPRAMDLTTTSYQLTDKFPKSEIYALTNQMRRAAISIAANIAEGSGRGTNTDFSHFLDIAKGSACELETQLLISINPGFAWKEDVKTIESELIEIQKMITGLQKALKT